MSDYLTAWQVASYLHVSRQRVEAIWRNAAYGFAQPIAESPRRWDRVAVESWADAHWWGTRNWRVRRGVL